MRCLKEIQNIVIGLLCKDRIKTNNKRYEKMYKVEEHDGRFMSLFYCMIIAFNYRYLVVHRKLSYEKCYVSREIYKIKEQRMKITTYKIPKNY